MIPRFYCPPAPRPVLRPGALIELPETAAHHALKVLRMKAGDPLILFDGQGGEWQAEIVSAGRSAQALLRAHIACECESPLVVTLAQALPSGDKMDWIVEKCVELGVTAIQPLATKRSVIRLSAERMEKRLAHWNQVARAACEQCGRNRVPVVAPVLDLPQYMAMAQADNAFRMILAPGAASALGELPPPAERPVIVMVGPEGGWEKGEQEAAQAAGFESLRLGSRVLRTETAGVAVLAAMQVQWGDF